MSPERWERLQRLFHRAAAAKPEERSRLLARESAGDEELRREVESLLAADSEGTGLFGPIAEAALELTAAALEPGDGVGSYRVVSELGRGGMGVVYLAERTGEDFEQQVALKVLAGIVASPGAVERFVAERRILAQLEHPLIARLLDGGTTAEGAPWFAMERVEGEPIDAWCDRRRLPVRGRLLLFLAVCDAVQHAHRRLVVHRDLKPSNILVGADGAPKLLDFGIAKLLDPGAEGAAPTRLGELPMTPEYASPEQVRGEPVTTASDVYSLGLLLYELLTGRRAHRLTSRERRDVERAVCEEPVTRPSLAASRNGVQAGRRDRPTTSEEIAETRRTTPRALRRRLAGDLDTIVLAALRKEPEARYGSVEALADDLRRHLDGLPVRARGDRFGYRTGKFVRRHRTAVAAAALVIVALLVGLLGTALQARRARAEARRAEQITEFLATLLRDADPDVSQGRELTVREVLDRAARSIEVELAAQPRLRAAMQALIGRIYGQLGHYQTAEAQLAAALERKRELLGRRHPEVADTANRLADVRLSLGETGDAERLATEGLSIRRQSLGERHPAVAESLVTLARVRFEQGDTERGRALLGEALALLGDDTPESRARLVEALHTAARIELVAGELERAEELVRRELDLRREDGRTTLGMALALDTLGGVLRTRGQPEQLAEAESSYLEAVEIQRSLAGEDSRAVANLLSNLAGTRAHRGDFAGGEEAFADALEVTRRALGSEHPAMGYLLNNVAVFYHRQERWSEAIDYYTRSLELRVRILGGEHPLVGTTRAYLGLALHMAGDDRAEATYRRALAELVSSRGPDHQQIGNLRADLGLLLAGEGRYREAEPELRRALAILQPIFGDRDQRTDSARAGLGFALCGLDRSEEGRPLLEASLDWRRERYPEDHWRRAEARLYESECLLRGGSPGEAQRQVGAVLDDLQRTQVEGHPLIRVGRRLARQADSPRSPGPPA